MNFPSVLTNLKQLSKVRSSFKEIITRSLSSYPERVPLAFGQVTPAKFVPDSIPKPNYALTGSVPPNPDPSIILWDEKSIQEMKNSAQFARIALDYAMSLVEVRVVNFLLISLSSFKIRLGSQGMRLILLFISSLYPTAFTHPLSITWGFQSLFVSVLMRCVAMVFQISFNFNLK